MKILFCLFLVGLTMLGCTKSSSATTDTKSFQETKTSSPSKPEGNTPSEGMANTEVDKPAATTATPPSVNPEDSLNGTWHGICSKESDVLGGNAKNHSNRVDLIFQDGIITLRQELYWDYECRAFIGMNEFVQPFQVTSAANSSERTIRFKIKHEGYGDYLYNEDFKIAVNSEGLLISLFHLVEEKQVPKIQMYRQVEYEAYLKAQADLEAKIPNVVVQAKGLYKSTGKDGCTVRVLYSKPFGGVTPVGNPATRQDIWIQPVDCADPWSIRTFSCSIDDRRCDNGMHDLYQNQMDGDMTINRDFFYIDSLSSSHVEEYRKVNQ